MKMITLLAASAVGALIAVPMVFAQNGADAGRSAAAGATPGTSMSSPSANALSSPQGGAMAPNPGLSESPPTASSQSLQGGSAPTTAGAAR